MSDVHSPSAIDRRPSTSFVPVAIVCLVFAALLPLRAVSQAPSEYDVKAAYLYNFGKFAKWPTVASTTFNICVLGANPFGEGLRSMVSDEKIDGKPATVRNIDSVHDASSCNILFISRTEDRRVRYDLEALAGFPVLTVSDIPGFTDDGGMIGFVNQSGKIRFNINLPAAQRAGLNLSSELLKVANSVKGKGP